MKFIFTICSLFYFFDFVPKNIIKTNINKDNYLFDNFSKIHLEYINKLDLVKLDDSYLYSNKTDSILYNNYYKNNLFRKVRLTHFFTPEKHLINSVWYPHYYYDIPILSIDLVNLGPNKSLVFMNLYEVDKKKYSNIFKQFLLKNKDFVEDRTIHLLPFKHVISDSMIYSHIYDHDKLERLENIMNSYIEMYLSTFLYDEKNGSNKAKHDYYNKVRKEIDKNFIYKQYLNHNELNYFIDKMYSDDFH